MIPPHSLEAEQAVIGAALTLTHTLDTTTTLLDPTDFYSPTNATIWAAILDHHQHGQAVDPTVILETVRTTITDAHTVIADCLTNVTHAADTLAQRLADYAATRRIQTTLTTGLDQISQDPTIDPAVLADQLTTSLAGIDLANPTGPVDGLWDTNDILAADFPLPPAIFPGFLRELDRVLLVGLEGSGKSVLTYQWALQAAAGRHPFTGETVDPVPSLIVDCENPMHRVRAGLEMFPRRTPTWAPVHLFSRPGGINIRNRKDRSDLLAVLDRTRPKVVAIGPLYKLHRSEPGETDEEAALRCQNILDDIRSTFDCALIIEHHAPKGSDSFRKLIPFGSSAWMRWPEFGWSLTPHAADRDGTMGRDSENGKSLRLGEFRGDRLDVAKPARFDRGRPWPWEPYWPDGMPVTRERF